MDMAAPKAVLQTRYFTLQKTIDVIHKASAPAHFLSCRELEDVLTLVMGVCSNQKVNIGNMHMAEERMCSSPRKGRR